jgi:hypothetical protein
MAPCKSVEHVADPDVGLFRRPVPVRQGTDVWQDQKTSHVWSVLGDHLGNISLIENWKQDNLLKTNKNKKPILQWTSNQCEIN